MWSAIWQGIISMGCSFMIGIMHITNRWPVHLQIRIRCGKTSPTATLISVQWNRTSKRHTKKTWKPCFTTLPTVRWTTLPPMAFWISGTCLLIPRTPTRRFLHCPRPCSKAISGFLIRQIPDGSNTSPHKMKMFTRLWISMATTLIRLATGITRFTTIQVR